MRRQLRPVASGNPNATLKFWIAWPAAPFTRLSMHATMTSCVPSGDTRQPMSQKFVCATCLISGRSAPVSRTNARVRVRRLERPAECRRSSTPGLQPRVDRLENAAIERHQVRHERHRHADFLFDLGAMAVREYAVRGHAAVNLGEVRALASAFFPRRRRRTSRR